MASKFGFGKIGAVVRTGHFAGRVVRDLGHQFIVPAKFAKDSTHAYEFGEIVEIKADGKHNYLIAPITTTTEATADLGVLLREVTGAVNVNQIHVENGVPNIALSVWVLRKNAGTVAVPIAGDDAVGAGDKVYLGNGTNSTVAGMLYTGSGAGKIEVKGLELKGKPNKPTDGTGKTVEIGAIGFVNVVEVVDGQD